MFAASTNMRTPRGRALWLGVRHLHATKQHLAISVRERRAAWRGPLQKSLLCHTRRAPCDGAAMML